MKGRFLLEVCILAGGLNSRMGRTKATLRLGRLSLLNRVRSTATEAGFSVRIIRHDLVPRCGPLGGVYTGLLTTPADGVLFLSCDMPFITPDLLDLLVNGFRRGARAVFVRTENTVGFPFVLARAAVDEVEKQLAASQFSLQALAKRLRARTIPLPAIRSWELFNINTPADFARAREYRRKSARQNFRPVRPVEN